MFENFSMAQVNHFLETNINTNKYFIGICMILLNISSKFVTIQFSKSCEQYLKFNITKQILIFCMGILATRDIVTSIMLVAAFTILSDHLFNEESRFCIVPEKHRILHKLHETTPGVAPVSEEDIKNANDILERAKREKYVKEQKENFVNFHEYLSTPK